MWLKIVNFIAWFMIGPWSFILFLYVGGIYQSLGKTSLEQKLLKVPVYKIRWGEFFALFSIEGLLWGIIFYV